MNFHQGPGDFEVTFGCSGAIPSEFTDWAPFPRALWEDPSRSKGADVDLHICMFLASDEIRRCIFNQSLQRGWALGGRLEEGRGNVTAKRVWAWEKGTLSAEPCL